MKKTRVIIIAAAVIAALTLAAVAAPAIMDRLNMRTLTSAPLKIKTEVPDGWIGVYTAEDLDNVRNDLNASYILMEDIDLSGYESWKPIGTEKDAFVGAFDGNGHAIRNMKINFTTEDYSIFSLKYYLGLFGYIRCVPSPRPESIVPDEEGRPILELLRWELKGYVKNLSLEDSVIIGAYDGNCVGNKLFAGGIAAFGDYIIGCQVKNTTIDITITEDMDPGQFREECYLAVGGIAGEAYLIDSCATNAEIIIRKEAEVEESYVSGLAGTASACVTSYFDGTISCGGLTDNGAVCFRDNRPPKLLTQAVMTELIDRTNANGSDPNGKKRRDENGNWYYEYIHSDVLDRDIITMDASVLYAFYSYKNLDLADAMELVTSEPEGDLVWLFDPYSSSKEYEVITQKIAGVFSESESFVDYCREHGLKYGVYYTYDLRSEPETDFGGFDFENIWDMGKDGKPELRIFG